MAIMDSLSWNIFTSTLCSYLIFLVVGGASRLLYHPLRGFPGPKLAALTFWYKAYYDIIQDGMWSDHILELHKIYGPVVRVAPNELHFSDPRTYAAIYPMGSKFTKDPVLYKCFGVDESVFGMTDSQEWAIRRNILGPFFSRRAILKLESVIQAKVDKLIERLLSYQSKKPANLSLAFRATSLDIITSYCFAKCNNALDADDFQNDILTGMEPTIHIFWVFKHFPFIRFLVMNCPEWLSYRMSSHSKAMIDQRRQLGGQIDSILANPASLEDAEYETIYHHFMKPPPGKEHHPLPRRQELLDEAFDLRFAGSDTIGNTCTVGTFYVLRDKRVYTKLINELDEFWPDRDSTRNYETLEKLPYLTAVVKESLRIAHGVITPLPRIVGPTDVEIVGTYVPKGTVVSIGARLVHRNPDIFPDPERFYPERWLQSDSQNLEKYLVAFSKGPRSCLGINLAWCELYLVLGNVFRKLQLEVDGVTTADDLRFREYFVPIYRGKSVHAHVKQRDH